MLACRLCLAWGIEDPEQWLENCPRRILNVWHAFAIADKWHSRRRMEAISAVSLKRLLAVKYNESDRRQLLESIDKIAELYIPEEWREENTSELDTPNEAVLKIMDRGGGNVLSTPTHSVDIDIGDPWQQR